MKSPKMIFFLLTITTVCTLILSGTEIVYKKASAVFSRRLYAVIMDMFEIHYEENSIEQAFQVNFETQRLGATDYYIAKKKRKGAKVFVCEGAGLWSRIELLLAIDSKNENMIGMRVLSQAETPGLGGRIGEVEFQERFNNISIEPRLEIVKFAMFPNQVDAVTGATKTSNALQTIINNSIEVMKKAFTG